jgi:DNA-binding LacI/PurR family transcriptional regulator
LQHLRDLGHEQVAFLDAPEARGPRLTRQVWAQVAEAADRRVLALTEPPTGEHAAVLRQWLDDGVTGLVAATDEVAARLLALLAARDMPVPPAISVVGFGDDFRWRDQHLTTVQINYEGIGSYAVDVLRSALYRSNVGHVANLHVAPMLVVRGTTAPLP